MPNDHGEKMRSAIWNNSKSKFNAREYFQRIPSCGWCSRRRGISSRNKLVLTSPLFSNMSQVEEINSTGWKSWKVPKRERKEQRKREREEGRLFYVARNHWKMRFQGFETKISTFFLFECFFYSKKFPIFFLSFSFLFFHEKNKNTPLRDYFPLRKRRNRFESNDCFVVWLPRKIFQRVKRSWKEIYLRINLRGAGEAESMNRFDCSSGRAWRNEISKWFRDKRVRRQELTLDLD